MTFATPSPSTDGRQAGRNGKPDGSTSPDFVRSLARGLDVIKAFGPKARR